MIFNSKSIRSAFFKPFCSIDGIVYLVLLSLIIVLKYSVIKAFAFVYTDTDQAVMWCGLKNYSNGLFHEPRFYGQAYNTMVESFLAVPFYRSGMPVYKALPIVSTILTVMPYVVISLLVFYKKSPRIALLILSLLLVLPIEYSLITSMPRCIGTGIFISLVSVIGIFYPRSKWTFFLASFFGVIACSFNPNAFFIVFFCLLYIFIINIRNVSFYLYGGLGIIVGLILHFAVNYFYIIHPAYNLHKIELVFWVTGVLPSLYRSDVFFNDVTPIFWHIRYVIFVLFVVIGIVLLKEKKYREAIIVLLMPLALIGSLGLEKVHDGSDSVFFSYSRMYLSVPILLMIALSFISDVFQSKLFYLFFLIPCAYFFYNINHLQRSIEVNTSSEKEHIIGVAKNTEVEDLCKVVKNICNMHNIELVIIANHWSADFLNYACPACIDSFPNTLRPSYERRTWRLVEDEKRVYKNILIIDLDNDLTKKFASLNKVENIHGFFVINNNKMYTMDLMNKLGIGYRPY